MTVERVINKEDLSASMWGMLLAVRWANRPGHIATPVNPTLCALERRGLVQSRLDPTAPHLSIWAAMAAGMALVDDEAVRSGRTKP